MKIKDPRYTEDLAVYGLYWIKETRKRTWSNNDDNLRIISMACCIPKQYKGIIVFDLGKVEVIDSKIDPTFIYHQSNTTGIHGIFHRALIEEGLYEGLIDDYGGNAYLRFMEILRLERN